ncbi:MAG: trigger factor [Desulfococcus sp. 4484_242]|nr:MAG: trigger factor [Desulfococcus sp. 4484_242]
MVMVTRVEDISSVKKKVTIQIESREVDRKINSAYRELRKKARIPGFRPGKVPRKILESRFWDDVADDVTRDLINESFPKALEEIDVMPLGTPVLEKRTLKQGEDFQYSVLIEVRPRIDLNDYLGMEVEKEEICVTDKDVAERIEQIRQSNGDLKSIKEERPVRKDDYVVLDYEAFAGQTPLDDKATNFMLQVGSNSFHPDFENALTGLKRLDETEIHVGFEDSYYNTRLAGKQVTFKVKILDIKELVVPELDDEFARNLGADFNNLEELREKVRESIVASEEKRIDREMKQRLVRKITERLDFEVPQVLVESELNYAVENFKQNLIQNGSSLEQIGITEEKLKSNFRAVSENRVREKLVLEEIARRENITLDDEDLAAGYQDLAAEMGMDAEIVRQYYEARDLVPSLEEKLREEKTLNYLVEHANIQTVDRDVLNENMSAEK